MLWDALPPLLLTGLLTGLCYAAGGLTLGLFLGGLGIAALLTPPLVMVPRTRVGRAAAATAIVAPICTAWLAVVCQSPLPVIDWLRACAVLAGFTVLLAGLVHACHRISLPAIAASALTVSISLAWLTWPVWLAPALRGEAGERVAAVLVPAHPLFALSDPLRIAFPVPWAQYRLAYKLTNLGDDIPYSPPQSIVLCLLLHLSAGAVLLWMCRRRLPCPPAPA